MIPVLKDIESREDVVLLVNRFYERVRQDRLLSPVFAHVDWLAHLPVMYAFWASMLLGEASYQGNPFQKHQSLALSADHFNKWIELFNLTVTENFCGARADEVIDRARTIASVFRHKLGLL